MNVGLIGYGRFGRLAARYLAEHADVMVFDASIPRSQKKRGRIRFTTLEKAASCPTVVLAIPISSMQEVLREIRPMLTTGALVVDVCAVKSRPIEWMKKSLPRHTRILGTHPLFGPDSASRSLHGKTIVLCPVRLPRATLNTLIKSLASLGLNTMVMTPAKHDRMMAETILLTQYVGRSVDGAGLHDWGPVSASYDHLRSIVRVARRDTQQLFLDMWRYNPYAPALSRALQRSLRKLAGVAKH